LIVLMLDERGDWIRGCELDGLGDREIFDGWASFPLNHAKSTSAAGAGGVEFPGLRRYQF
jgi:hypothetical protein